MLPICQFNHNMSQYNRLTIPCYFLFVYFVYLKYIFCDNNSVFLFIQMQSYYKYLKLSKKAHKQFLQNLYALVFCYLYIGFLIIPMRCKKWVIDTFSTPKPYFTLRLKLIDDASSKYLVGQVISAISKPLLKI